VRSLPLVSDGFEIEPELTWRAARAGARFCEVPISYAGRGYDEGKKIGWRDGVRALATILRLGGCLAGEVSGDPDRSPSGHRAAHARSGQDLVAGCAAAHVDLPRLEAGGALAVVWAACGIQPEDEFSLAPAESAALVTRMIARRAI